MQTSPQTGSPEGVTRVADTKLVSVVIPVYNGAAYLAATLQSVLAQSSAPAEVIVIDDGSTDDSAAIARSFGVTLISQKNSGLSAARNAGTHAAKGQYIAYLDSDDLWLPEKLQLQLAALQSYGRPAFCFTDYRMFDESGTDSRYGVHTHPAFLTVVPKRARRTVVRDQILIETKNDRPVLPDDYILPSSTVIRRADFIAIGGFDETLRISEDHEFFLRLFRIVPAIALMQPLVLYRRHATQISSKPIALVSAFFDIERRIAAMPERYPQGDVEYFRRAAYLAHRRIGVLQARLGNFSEARESFMRSLTARPTSYALFGLCVSSIGESHAGRLGFVAARAALRRFRATMRAYRTSAAHKPV